MMCMNSGITST